MAKVYLQSFQLPSLSQETFFLRELKHTCYNSVYPYNLFPQKELHRVEFSPITVFYGGNGSGKTTLLNLIAEKCHVFRRSPFNGSSFFEQYANSCSVEGSLPRSSQILTSDDVFDHILDLRCLNDGIDNRRQQLFEEFTNRKYAHQQLRSLSDYDDFKDSCDAKFRSQSQFVRDRLMSNPEMYSNGESAMRYFMDQIQQDALYLLDEPENSLSIQLQLELADFLVESARFYNCQFIIATHSPVLLAMPGVCIYDLDSVPVTTKKWTELDNVRRFFNFFMEHQNEF